MSGNNSAQSSIVLPFRKNNFFIIIPASIVYPLFFSKFYDLVISDNITKKYMLNNEEKTNNKYAFMLIVGILGIAIGLYFAKKKYIPVLSYSIIAGGIITIVSHTMYNWNNISSRKKLVITVLSIVILLHSCYRMIFSCCGIKKDVIIKTLTPGTATQSHDI